MLHRSLLCLLRVHPKRLASVPRLRVVTVEGATTRLTVDGLVCGVCAARTASALRAVPGVRAASVDLGRGTAEVWTDAPVSAAALQQALASVVVAPGVRRALERAMTWWRTRGFSAPGERRA